MLRSLLLLSLLAATAQNVSGQAYHPFPASNTIWAENFLPHDDSARRIVYRGLLQHDTLIGGKTYHCVYESRDTSFITKKYLGALRDDTAARKVWFIPPHSGTTEYLLYNFNLKVGDSARFNENYINLFQSIAVKAVDSINIGGAFRRRIIFDYPYPTMWVEGVGNQVRGLLWFASTFPNNGSWNELVCMKDSSSWIYHVDKYWVRWFNNAYPACERLQELNQPPQSVETPETGPQVSIVPNPLSGEGSLRISHPGIYETLRIYTANGAFVAGIDVRKKTEVPLRGAIYPEGLYLYRLSGTHAMTATGRFLVVH